MPIRKAAKRPEKLQCRPGYVQRGAACQKISSKGGIAKKAGLALGGAIAAYVAASAATRMGKKEQEVSPPPPTPDETKYPSSWKRKALTGAAIAGGVVGGSITTASIASHVKAKMAEREAKRAEEAAQQADWTAKAEEREQRLEALAYDEINGEKAHPELKKNLRKLEDSIKNNNFETIAVLDSEGEEIVNQPGDKYEVGLNRAQTWRVRIASDRGRGPILTHNHPQWGKHSASFSIEDVQCAEVLKVKQLRAVSRDEIFIMNPPKGGMFTPELTKKIQASYEKRLEEVSNQYVGQIRWGGMSASEANMRASHEAWKLVAQDVPEITYQKIPRGNSKYIKGYSDE